MNTFFLILFLVIWGIFHSFLASMPVKKFIQNKIRRSVSRFYRLLYNVFAVISFLPIIGLSIILPDTQLYSIQNPWVYFLLAIQFLSLAIITIGLKQTGILDFLGLIGLMGSEEHFPKGLCMNGLYKFVRHPLYSAGLLFMWCSPIMTTNSFIISFCLTIYIVIGAKIEERKLVAEFGEIYEDYRLNVPMLIPSIRWNKME